MINIYHWGSDRYQVVLESFSFYFQHKLCFAFREKANPVIFVRGEKSWGNFQNPYFEFVQSLAKCSEIRYLCDPDFKYYLSCAYSKALLTGVRRIGLEKIFNCNIKEIDHEHQRASLAGLKSHDRKN